MSAVLGVFGERVPLTDEELRRMLAAMAPRGADHVAVWREGSVVLAVQRFDWEMAPGFSGSALLAQDERYVVAADASLYYRHELRRTIQQLGVVPGQTDSPAELILAAFRARGVRCVDHLEGDFAFIVWDRQRRQAMCARDFGGKRPLFYAALGRELVIASTIGAAVAHPRCPSDPNLPVIGATAAGLLSSAGPETCYAAVRSLPTAHSLEWNSRGIQGLSRYWSLPVNPDADSRPLDEAAEHLRHLLCAATTERLDPRGPNTVWMSGGWDSTSVFAAAQEGARSAGLGKPVPVSITYPEGDPGREDDWILDVANRWESPVHWLDIASIPFFDREGERAAGRDEPYAHTYEIWNRALAAGSRACGARVAFDGNGGDQLFQSSDIYMADLFSQGRWLRLWREWRSRKRGGARRFFATAVQPNLSDRLLRLAATLRRGRPLRHYLERRMPGWMDARFIARHRLVERDLEFINRPVEGSHAAREMDFYFSCDALARAFSHLGTFALTEGVELRSPLYDRRIVEFAVARPWWERSSGVETKVLLRRAMRGLLSEQLLAPRAHRTGITAGYSHAWVRDRLPAIVDETLRAPMLLEELGIVDSQAFRRASATYRGYDGWACANLANTLRAELWLRARFGSVNAGPAPSNVNRRAASGALA